MDGMGDSSAAYEKLGAFYLGRPFDAATGKTAPVPLLYDSRDLLTHAVCVGMTGSGKTGLLIGLLEEAAIDGIPALVIDPKGDLANLLLTFPDLKPADFAPWIDPDAAARAGMTPEAFAAREAETWRAGLDQWGQTGERIARLRAAAEFAIYTPGSEAGLQISILSSLAAPPPEVIADGDALRERTGTLVASLLSLLDVDSDPVQGREHILLASIFDSAWREGRGLDLASLIQQIQKPPMERVGVMDLETFFPAQERFKLAMAFNNLLGSPNFAAWLRGDPLDVDRLLYSPTAKPRIAIFSIAHLSDRERMFFVSLLLNQTLGWMRGKTGTTSLRAILAMDEVFGYMPPVAEPPSKRPLLTLLKQARAFGVGLVLASQNPVDLDYKGLSNVGTWFLGRLQTERDKARLMDGLEGATAGGHFDRAKTEQLLSGLPGRVFLLHDVHEDEPALFQTRWTLSYLRGPLTRPEIKRLMDPFKALSTTAPAAAPQAPAATGNAKEGAPVLPPDVGQRFLPVRAKPEGIVYEPRLFATAAVHYQDAKRGLDHVAETALLTPLTDDGADWYKAETVELTKDDLETEAVPGARFAPLPDAAVKAKSYDAWRKALEDCLYRTARLDLFNSGTIGLASSPGESERDFRVRLADTAREKRDEQIAALRGKYGVKIAQLQERIRRAEQARQVQADQARQQTLSTVIHGATAVLGMFFGRAKSLRSISAVGTAARGAGRTLQEQQDVARADETLAALQKQLADLNAELETEAENLKERFDPAAGELETVSLKPRKSDVEVRFLTLAWSPGA